MKKTVVLGAGGFIGGQLVSRLKSLGYWVRGVDIKWHEFKKSDADEFIIADLRKRSSVNLVIDETIDEVYQLAADMGGAEYIFSGLNDADIMHNSVMINLNVCEVCSTKNIKKVFYSSSACIYPEDNQLDPDNPNCEESSAYPANPDSEYGWEKIFSERIYQAYNKNKGLNIRIARFHNIFGPYGTWTGGKEKAPAAICRKVAETKDNGIIEGVKIKLLSRCGFSPDLSGAINSRALLHIDNAYYLSDVLVENYLCKTNTSSSTAFRGFGGNQGMMIIENI